MSEAAVPAVAAEQAVGGLGGAGDGAEGGGWRWVGVPGGGGATPGAATAETVAALESSAEEVDAEVGTPGLPLAAELTEGVDLDWGTMPLGLFRLNTSSVSWLPHDLEIDKTSVKVKQCKN